MLQFGNKLSVEAFRDVPKLGTVGYLAGAVDFPSHPNVQVVVYPCKGQSPEDPELLKSAEVRCHNLVSNVDKILADGIPKIRRVLGRFYAETKLLSDEELLRGLRLEYVKLSSKDELIFKGNRHYHGLDLNLIVKTPSMRVGKAWMDG